MTTRLEGLWVGYKCRDRAGSDWTHTWNGGQPAQCRILSGFVDRFSNLAISDVYASI